MEPDRVWHAIRMGAEKYCLVAQSILSELAVRLKLNGKEMKEL